MLVKNQLLSLKAYEPGKTVEEIKNTYGLKNIVKLASNENPYGCSKKVSEALANFSAEYALYPDGAAGRLRERVAKHVDVDPKALIFGSGLDEVIQIISRSLLTPQSNIVMAAPSFSQYKLHAVIEGAEVREVPTVDGYHDLESMLKRVDPNTKIVWLCNPNNPTGTYVNGTSLKSFLQRVPQDTLVVLDEAYYEYVTASDYPNTLPLLAEYDNLMILRTFSKAYGLAGFRVGYGIGSPDLIQLLEVTRLPFNTNRLGQTAAVAALDDEAFLQHCVRKNKNGLDAFTAFCNKNHLGFYPSQANFIFLKTDQANSLFELLLQKGFIIRPFPNGVRITIGKEEDNRQLLLSLQDILDHESRHLLSS
ncbi:histidinol-phosphate transaminase [Scopulibacillus darangshiensis]|nr:histidinol-phosphate transaminase [Scopulibacillus darangshiensis]